MKVTFTCEKCGHVFREYKPVANNFYIYQNQSDYQCPNCSKLSYGPLTEEMVAEALDECDFGDGRVFQNQACEAAMTRLIDADALVAYFERLEGDTIAVTDAAAVADNAPTVCCAECVNYAPYHEAWGECACGHMEAEHMPRPTFGCVDFERRQS